MTWPVSNFLKFASRQAVSNSERVGGGSVASMERRLLKRIAAMLDKRQLVGILLALLVATTAFAEHRLADLRVSNPKHQSVRLSQLRKDRRVMVLVFVASTCPVTQLYWERIKGTWYNFRDREVSLVLVGGNSDDAIEIFQKLLDERELEDLPVVWDEKHALARHLGVEFTPTAVVLGRDWEVLYRGRIDDAWRDESRVTKRHLTDAINEALTGRKSSDHVEDGFMGSRLR